MSPQKKIQLGILTVLLLISAVVSVALLLIPKTPPSITGVLIPDALPLREFTLVDHKGRNFTRQDLLGRWHMVSYGYTHCPDICPTTLSTLAQVAREIKKDQVFKDVQVLFYSVDPARDTPTRLAEYVPWFNEDFLGLSTKETGDNRDLSFEKSLGIMAILTPIEVDEGLEDHGGYAVSHGVSIYLLNPDGDLQAVFKPQVDKAGVQYFTVEQIYGDYRKIRRHLG